MWTGLIAGSLSWDVYSSYEHVIASARFEAVATYNKDINYGKWATQHGGVYVPVSETQQPNPFLTYITDRDVTTTDGKKLTLINPAYMFRQVYELADPEYGVRERITSLDPVNPENAPDQWERKALETFKVEPEEIASLEDVDGEKYMRLIVPMITREKCLKCHGHQGYKTGNIRGGISVSVPMERHFAAFKGEVIAISATHGLLWLIGLAAILYTVRQMEVRRKATIRVQEEILKSEERFRLLYERSPLGYQSLDKDGFYIEVNPALAEMLGYDRGEMIGKWFGDVLTDEGRKLFKESFPGFKAAGSTKNTKYEMVRKDGSCIHVEIDGRVGYNQDGSFKQTHCVLRDITKLKKSQEERERLLSIVAGANRELESVIRVISHDLRSPLVNINGFSHELAGDCKRIKEFFDSSDLSTDSKKKILPILEEHVPQSLDYIIKSTEKMDKLLGSLSRLSKIGKADITIRRLDMNVIVESIVKTMQFQIQEVRAEITCGDLPDCMGDEMQVNQVFSNLLNNALKYLDPERDGRINISGKVEAGQSIYCVEDNGVGIAKNNQGSVFELFYRTHTKTDIEGEGVGLSVVARILDRINGEARLESEEGKGSRFFISLPHA